MLHLALVPLLLLSADPKWEVAAETDGVKVYRRDKPGSEVKEMKANGTIDAPPKAVWDVIRAVEAYPKTMPYTEEAKVISRSEGDKEIYFYSRIKAPMVAQRDYVIVLKDESTTKDDGTGAYKVSWSTAAPEKADSAVPEKKDVVRVRINDGYWLLESADGGKKTNATYYLYTSPGGSVPTFIVNAANGTAVPDVFKAIKKAVAPKK